MSTEVQEMISIEKSNELLKGIRASIPIALGYLPIAVAFGLLAKTAGTSYLIALMLSGLVYAGASQFVAVQMLMTGTPILNIVFLTFILNLRHFLMSATLSTRIAEKSNSKLALIAFGITDESFSVASLTKGKLSFLYMCGLNFTAYSAWFVGTVLGYLVGSGLPEELQNSMGIALYAMFVGLLIPSVKKSVAIALVVVVAAALNSILIQYIPAGTAIILSTIITASVAAFLLPQKGSDT